MLESQKNAKHLERQLTLLGLLEVSMAEDEAFLGEVSKYEF